MREQTAPSQAIHITDGSHHRWCTSAEAGSWSSRGWAGVMAVAQQWLYRPGAIDLVKVKDRQYRSCKSLVCAVNWTKVCRQQLQEAVPGASNFFGVKGGGQESPVCRGTQQDPHARHQVLHGIQLAGLPHHLCQHGQTVAVQCCCLHSHQSGFGQYRAVSLTYCKQAAVSAAQLLSLLLCVVA